MSVHLSAGTLIRNSKGEYLLVQEGKEHVRGQWNIPSGGFGREDEDRDETIREAAVRETLEETGIEVKLEGLVGIYTRESQRTDAKNVFVVFEASKIGGNLKPVKDNEIIDAKFFSLKQIEELEQRIDIQKMIKDLEQKGSVNANVRPLDY